MPPGDRGIGELGRTLAPVVANLVPAAREAFDPSLQALNAVAAVVTILGATAKAFSRSDKPAAAAARELRFQMPNAADVKAGLELLGLTTKHVSLFATPGHRLFGQATHPADRLALMYVSAMLGFTRAVKRGDNIEDNYIVPDFEGTQVIFGGVNSQPWIRALFEFDFTYKDRNHKHYRNPDYLTRRARPVLPLPYVPTTNADDPAVPHVRMRGQLGGPRARRPAWSFVGANSEVGRPKFVDGYRTLDWLQITRLRNFLSPTWGQHDEGYIVYVSGASGVGTQAVPLLFQPGVARELSASLSDVAEFQILLPVEVAYSESGMFPVRIDASRSQFFPLRDLNQKRYSLALQRLRKRVDTLMARFK